MNNDQAKSDSQFFKSVSARDMFTETLQVGRLTVQQDLALSDFNVTGVVNAQATMVITGQHSKRFGNLVQTAFNATLDMLVDYTAYPVLVGSIPVQFAPKTSTFLPMCLGNTDPTFGVFVLVLKPDGTFWTCTTGLPFPTGLYTLSVSTMYFV